MSAISLGAWSYDTVHSEHQHWNEGVVSFKLQAFHPPAKIALRKHKMERVSLFS
jgi:hypothetical protein